uniref:SCHIP-1 domain-containing protein n=1 Tax=Trichuris muris TaxID=70415 RepID=A0A5S6QXY9_TRIMR
MGSHTDNLISIAKDNNDLAAVGVESKNNSYSPNGVAESVLRAGCALDSARQFAEEFDDSESSLPARNPNADEDNTSCLSHSSSLESSSEQGLLEFDQRVCSPTNVSRSRRGNEEDDDNSSFGGSTSCSEDSFVLTNCSSSSADPNSPHCCNKTVETAKDLSQCLSSLCSELQSLDSLMPVVDFEKLEKHWVKAAEDREMVQRRQRMSEQVRRRLAMEEFDKPGWLSKRQHHRSSFGSRLQSGMNLEVCFVNDSDLCEQSDESDKVEEGVLHKSVSTPNFAVISAANGSPEQASHCTMSASELRRMSQEDQGADFAAKQKRLEKEALLLLTKAQEAAHMQMEVERQARQAAPGALDALIGVSLSQQKRLSRSQLTRMSTTCLQIILNDLHAKIRELNDELVQLLVQKDTLHMEQDSMLVDIADLLQHRKDESPSLPSNFVAEFTTTTHKYDKLFKIFRR